MMDDLCIVKFYTPGHIEIDPEKIRVSGQEMKTARAYMTTKDRFPINRHSKKD